jgi:Ca-activated chloride channel family protein
VRPARPIAPEPESAGPSLLRASVNWVRVPVHVLDESGAPRAGLTRTQFALFEDGRRQEIRGLAVEETPVSLTVVFDASSSMKARLNESRAALRQLFPHALPGDEYALVAFGNDARLVESFTREAADLARAAARIEVTTWTALYDAVYLGLAQARHGANARKALLVLSDGGDNNSRYTASELRSYAREAGVEIYSIGIGGASKQLRQLAADTGGIALNIRNEGELPEAVTRMSRLLRSRYVLDYASTNPARDGLWRRIDVRVTSGIAYARGGYYQPLD